jgi:hypothetical protein
MDIGSPKPLSILQQGVAVPLSLARHMHLVSLAVSLAIKQAADAAADGQVMPCCYGWCNPGSSCGRGCPKEQSNLSKKGGGVSCPPASCTGLFGTTRTGTPN